MTTNDKQILTMLHEMARTITRLETRLCRIAVHVGAQEAAGIPATKIKPPPTQPTTDPRQLPLHLPLSE